MHPLISLYSSISKIEDTQRFPCSQLRDSIDHCAFLESSLSFELAGAGRRTSPNDAYVNVIVIPIPGVGVQHRDKGPPAVRPAGVFRRLLLMALATNGLLLGFSVLLACCGTWSISSASPPQR